jgi:hypothetical protein
MFLQRFLDWLLSTVLILTTGPTPAYTAPFVIEKVDYPADTYTGTHISLAYNQTVDRTYISYYDVTHHTLKLAYYTGSGQTLSCNGISGNWACLTLDGDGSNGTSTDDVGMYSSVDITTAAFLGIGVSYYDKTHQAVKYAQYACAFTCQPPTVETVSDPGPGLIAGSFGTALKYSKAGVPYILYSYVNSGNANLDALMLAHRVDSGGNCGDGASYGKWQCDMIDQGDRVGQYPSMALTDSGSGIYFQLAYIGAGNTLHYAVNVGNYLRVGRPITLDLPPHRPGIW